MWRHPDGSSCGRSFIDGTRRWLEWEHTGVFAFGDDTETVEFWPAADASPDGVRERFGREITAVILQALGAEAMHASAVRGPHGAVLVCGPSGAGKSTLAFALGRAGWPSVADDHVVFEIADGRPRLRPLPFTPSLRPQSRRHFGTDGGGVHDIDPGPIPIAGIVLLRQAPDLAIGITHHVVPGPQAFTALLPHAHCFDVHTPETVNRLVNDYWALIERVPVYEVAYRPDFTLLPRVVAQTQRLFDNVDMTSLTGGVSSDAS